MPWLKFQNAAPVSLISFGTVSAPLCALISDCASASHVASSKMLTRICCRLLNSQSASCLKLLAILAVKWVSVSESKRRLRRRHRMTNGCLDRQVVAPSTPSTLRLGAIFSAHCGCHFRFSSSQVFCQLFCNAGCGLSAAQA